MLENFVTEVKGFLMNPAEAFQKTKGESLGAAYKYYVTLLVIFTVLFGIVTVAMSLVAFTNMMNQIASVPIIGWVLAAALAKFSGFIIALDIFFVYMVFLVSLFWIFISGLVMHVFVLLMGGEKGVVQTIKTGMYANTPALLLGWIPYIAIIGVIWTLVLFVIGYRENQEMVLGHAILVVLIPIVLGLIAIILGAAVIVAFMGSIASLLPGALF